MTLGLLALAVGLVSFTTSHANRIDVETLNQALGTFEIGPGANFSLRRLVCLFRVCPRPCLGPRANTSSADMALPIDVDDIAFLWDPISIHGSMIETEKGLIVPV